MLRIDTHHHAVPADYRNLLRKAGIDEAGGRAVPEWSPDGSLQTMTELGVGTAILSVSAPGTTFLPKAADTAALARDLNDYLVGVVAARPDRFGFFATIPMPHVEESADEVARSLDELHADGVILLANAAGTYLGQDGQDELFAALDARSAVVFIHPADLPGPPWTASYRSLPTSCWTLPARRICLSATKFGASTRTSGSSSATPADSCPTPRTEWRSAS
jgi:predicted TIM-barrel fold metal-dependent hydrolase